MQDDNENKTTTEEKDPYAELFTMESYQRIWAMRRKANKEWKEQQEQWKLDQINRNRAEKGLLPLESLDNKHAELEKRLQNLGDDPNALGNAPATILYVFVMIAGSIFNDRLYIWIIATIIWLRHIFRMEIKRQNIIDEYNKNKSEKEKYR